MIPAKPNTYAIFSDTYRNDFKRHGAEVIAWADNGWAMVLPSDGRGLEAINPWDIKRIEEHEDAQFEHYAQFTPVSDLFSLHYDKESRRLFQKRLIGWAVTTGGAIVPVAEEGGDGMIAVSRDDDYLTSFRAADRERAFADARDQIEEAERRSTMRDAESERFWSSTGWRDLNA